MESIIDTQTINNFINESSNNVNSPSIHIVEIHNKSGTAGNMSASHFSDDRNATMFFNINSNSVTISQGNYKVSLKPNNGENCLRNILINNRV